MNKSCCQKHQLYSFSLIFNFLLSSFRRFSACRHRFFCFYLMPQWKKKVMKIDHHRGPVVNVAISSTSQVLVSGSHDATICLWSLETYELLNLMQFNSPVLNFCLSPDSVWMTFFYLLLNHLLTDMCQIQVFLLAHCEDNGLYLRTLATGTELHQLKGHKSKVNKTT